ncbi:hypothetical protein [Candidatus Ruthia endofausta]
MTGFDKKYCYQRAIDM